jgi:hypothetical protein
MSKLVREEICIEDCFREPIGENCTARNRDLGEIEEHGLADIRDAYVLAS